jgi:hypothetical protein
VLEEYRYDVVGFSDAHCGVELHDGQKRFLREAFSFNDDGSFVYKYPNLTASNRWGKTVVVAIVHLWFAVFKHGLAIEGADWFKHPYHIMNICPLVDLANLARDAINDILQNKAKEQINRPSGRGHSDLGPLFERGDDGYLITFGDYKGFKTKVSNVSMEYRTSADNFKAGQGKSLYLVTFDEAGRQKNFQAMMGAHVVPRTLDTNGMVATFSTPDVDTGTDYEEWCNKGDSENFFRDKLFFYMRGTVKDNPHLTPKMIRDMTAGVAEFLIPQVLEGKFVQGAEAFFPKPSLDRAFRVDIRPEEGRVPGHLYIIGCDLAVAKAGDRSVFVVWDITKPPFQVLRVIEPKRGTPHPQLIATMKELLEFYNAEWPNPADPEKPLFSEAELVYDSTGLGGKMFKTELSTLTPAPRGYDFGGVTKAKFDILSSLRLLLDKDLLLIPAVYGGMKQELKNYKRTDAKLETDSVMAMALAAYLAERALPVDIDEDGWSEDLI